MPVMKMCACYYNDARFEDNSIDRMKVNAVNEKMTQIPVHMKTWCLHYPHPNASLTVCVRQNSTRLYLCLNQVALHIVHCSRCVLSLLIIYCSILLLNTIQLLKVSLQSQCVLIHCGSMLRWEWHADSWASVWVSPALTSPEQASALTPHISLTLMDTCSLCAWQDGLLRKLNKNSNSDWVDTPQWPADPSSQKNTFAHTQTHKHIYWCVHYKVTSKSFHI